MMRIATAAVSIFAVTFVAAGWQVAPPQGAALAGGTIQGGVMNAANEPLFSARVELSGGAQGSIVSRTDGQGRFVFANVPQGRYRVSVKKEGYIRQEYGQNSMGGTGTLIVIEPGTPPPASFNFRLQPAATMAGAVRNEDGFPIANILVQAMRRSYGVRGNRTITVFSNTLTDDLGAYRLYWVDPGDYYVNASYLPQLPTPVNANADAPRASYAPTYFPGAADPKDAKAVHLDSGNLFGGIDFKLQRSPAVKVRGAIFNILTQAPAQATVLLTAFEESGSTARYSIQTDEKGVFEMKGVNPGSYVLSAKTAGDALLGFSTIRVSDQDYPRADVVIGPGMTIGAQLFGQLPPATDLRSLQIALVPLETFLPEPKPSVMQSNGALAIAGVQPGDYLLSVSGLPDTGYVKAAQSNQRDVLEQFVRVQYDTQARLDIQLAFDGGQITGVVGDAAGQTANGATVVLVPDKTRRHRPDQYRVIASGADGKFAIGGIPPGDYKLFAWNFIEANAWVNPDVMAEYEEFGAAATVGASEKVSAQLRLIPEKR
jgi:hypothetical protein